MSSNSDKIRAVLLSLLMVGSVFGATVAMTGTAAAAFNSASATDLAAGQASATQTVSINATLEGGPGDSDIFVIDATSLTNQNGSVSSATVTTVDNASDTASVQSGNTTSDTVQINATDGNGDGAITFNVEITADTQGATAASGLTYVIDQFDTGSGVGGSAPSSQSVSYNLNAPATLDSATALGGTNNVSLVFDTDQDYAAVSGPGDYTVEIDGQAVTVTNVNDGNANDATAQLQIAQTIEADDNVQVSSAGNVNVGAFDTAATVKAVTASPSNVVFQDTLTVTLTFQNFSNEDVDYAITGPGGTFGDVVDGSTSSSSVQARITFTKLGDYAVEATGQTSGDTVSTTILSKYDANITTTPADPQLGDSVQVEGSILEADGTGVSGVNLQVQDGADNTAATVATAGDGTFIVQVDASDAGTYTIEDQGSNQVAAGTEYANFTTGPQEANVSITAQGNNLANFAETYTVTATDAQGDALSYATVGGEENYINVTGPFDETTITATNATVLRSAPAADVDNDTDNDTAYVHVQPNSDNATLTLTPLNASVDVTATLENDLTFDPAVEPEYTGIENGTVATPNTPDYVGSASVDVAQADDLNVEYTVGALSVDSNPNSLSVDILGSDAAGPDGPGGNVLNFTTVSVTGPGVDTSVENNASSTTSVSGLAFSEAGVANVSVTAVTDDGEEFTDSETFNVSGDQLVSVSPTSTTVDNVDDITVAVNNEQGTPVNNRVVTLTGVDFNVTDTNGDSQTVSTIEIDGAAGEITNGGAVTIEDSLVVNNGQYTVQNVGYDTTGSVDVTVTSGGTTTIDAPEQIDVQGVDAYELTSDTPTLLLTSEETVTLNVTENGAAVGGGELSTLAGNLEASQNGTDVLSSPATVVNGSIEATILADAEADAPVTVSVDNGAGKRGETNLSVVEPEIQANASTFTELVTSEDVGLTVVDPRTGQNISSTAEVQLTAQNTSFNVSGSVVNAGGTTTVTTDANGSAALAAVTPDVAPEGSSAGLAHSVKITPASANYFANVVIPVGEISTGAPDTLPVNTQSTVDLIVQDAEGFGLSNRDVGLQGAGVGSVTGTTDADGLASFTISPSSGIIDVQVDSEFNNTLVTVDTISVFEEVTLTLTADATTIQQNDSVTFTLQRDDAPSVNPSGTLTIRDASTGDALNTVAVTQGTATVAFNSAGEFEVVASKAPTGGKTFVNDSVTITVEADEPPTPGNATDPDGDGKFEDVNGNGAFTLSDVTFLFDNQNADFVQNNPDAFDFNDNGDFTLADVTFLFQEASS